MFPYVNRQILLTISLTTPCFLDVSWAKEELQQGVAPRDPSPRFRSFHMQGLNFLVKRNLKRVKSLLSQYILVGCSSCSICLWLAIDIDIDRIMLRCLDSIYFIVHGICLIPTDIIHCYNKFRLGNCKKSIMQVK